MEKKREEIIKQVVVFTKQWKIKGNYNVAKVTSLMDEYCSIYGESEETYDKFYNELTNALGLGERIMFF